MAKKKYGRLPQMATGAEFVDLGLRSSSELVSMRADIGSLMHAHGAAVNRLRVEGEAITAILHARDKPDFEVSDHAIVRWLQKVKGYDMNALRAEIAAACREAKTEGENAVCRAKGDAVAYTKDSVTFVVAHRNNIVTVVFGDYLNPIAHS